MPLWKGMKADSPKVRGGPALPGLVGKIWQFERQHPDEYGIASWDRDDAIRQELGIDPSEYLITLLSTCELDSVLQLYPEETRRVIQERDELREG